MSERIGETLGYIETPKARLNAIKGYFIPIHFIPRVILGVVIVFVSFSVSVSDSNSVSVGVIVSVRDRFSLALHSKDHIRFSLALHS